MTAFGKSLSLVLKFTLFLAPNKVKREKNLTTFDAINKQLSILFV